MLKYSRLVAPNCCRQQHIIILTYRQQHINIPFHFTHRHRNLEKFRLRLVLRTKYGAAYNVFFARSCCLCISDIWRSLL